MVKNLEKAEIEKEKKKAVKSRSRSRSPKQISAKARARSLGMAKKSFSSSRIVAMTSKMNTAMSYKVTSNFCASFDRYVQFYSS